MYAVNMNSSEQTEREASVEVLMPMIAFPTHAELTTGFKQGMEDLGYEEGVDVVYLGPDEPITPNPEGLEEIRNTIRTHIEEGVDVIVVSSNPDAQIALEETADAERDVPIVALDVFDPVGKGFVESIEAPGGNMTGVAERRADSVGKFLEIFTTIVPDMETMGVLTSGFMIPSPVAPASDFLEALRQQTEVFGIELVEYSLDSSVPQEEVTDELERVLSNIEEGEVDSWVHMPGHFIHDQQVYEHDMGLRTNIPVGMPATIENDPESGDVAGLFAYGADFARKGAQGAVFVDKIARGADPGELPIEFPEKYELIINTTVAGEIGLEIPQEVLGLADEIVE